MFHMNWENKGLVKNGNKGLEIPKCEAILQYYYYFHPIKKNHDVI